MEGRVWDMLVEGVVVAASVAAVVLVGSAPSSLFGIAVPWPVRVQGVGTGRREVRGRACGAFEYMFPVPPLGRDMSPEIRLAMAPVEEL